MTTRVWFENDAIQMDGVGVIPARGLTAVLDGDRIHLVTLSGDKTAQLDYHEYAKKDGSGFPTAALAKAYLDGELSKTVVGQAGATWTIGNGTPSAAAGPNDLYLDTTTGDIYRNN